MSWAKSLFAILAGYVVMVLGAWFGQESVFPNAEWGSPLPELLAVGFLTTVFGGLGGVVTALLAPSRPFLHLLPMAVLISIETVVLFVSGRVDGPLWFELLAGATLIGGNVVGAWVGTQLKQRVWTRSGGAV